MGGFSLGDGGCDWCGCSYCPNWYSATSGTLVLCDDCGGEYLAGGVL